MSLRSFRRARGSPTYSAAAGLAARHGGLDDRRGHHRNVAQLDKVRGQQEVPVVLLDLVVEQLHPVQGPLQALLGADDADVIPHEPADLVPVLRDDHGLVGLDRTARVPFRRRGEVRSGPRFRSALPTPGSPVRRKRSTPAKNWRPADWRHAGRCAPPRRRRRAASGRGTGTVNLIFSTIASYCKMVLWPNRQKITLN